jgi:hypothetical protein
MRVPCWVRLRSHRWEATTHEYWVRLMCTQCKAWRLIAYPTAYWDAKEATQWEDL